jgi:hypothetical protein
LLDIRDTGSWINFIQFDLDKPVQLVVFLYKPPEQVVLEALYAGSGQLCVCNAFLLCL